MALISCEECGAEISDKAQSCPKCGFPISKESNQQSTIKITDSNKDQNNNFAILICVFLFFSTLFLYNQYISAEKVDNEMFDEYIDCLGNYSCDYKETGRELDRTGEKLETAGNVCGVSSIMFLVSLIFLYRRSKSDIDPYWQNKIKNSE